MTTIEDSEGREIVVPDESSELECNLLRAYLAAIVTDADRAVIVDAQYTSDGIFTNSSGSDDRNFALSHLNGRFRVERS